MKLTICVQYRTPSLNKTRGEHWTVHYREKRRAYAALECALRDIVHSHSILTISPEALKIYSTASDTLASYLATSIGAFSSKPPKKKLKA
jgi:hypothetical protein